jgi:hypothetical protein
MSVQSAWTTQNLGVSGSLTLSPATPRGMPATVGAGRLLRCASPSSSTADLRSGAGADGLPSPRTGSLGESCGLTTRLNGLRDRQRRPLSRHMQSRRHRALGPGNLPRQTSAPSVDSLFGLSEVEKKSLTCRLNGLAGSAGSCGGGSSGLPRALGASDVATQPREEPESRVPGCCAPPSRPR